MHIRSSSVNLFSSYNLNRQQSTKLTTGNAGSIQSPQGPRVELASPWRARVKGEQVADAKPTDADPMEGMPDSRTYVMKKIVERLTGSRISTIRLREGTVAPASGESIADVAVPAESIQSGMAETQRLAFSASGTVRTEDGRTTAFRLDIAVTSEFYSRTTLSSGRPVDPLVLTTGDEPLALGDGTFAFDLNADGTLENLRQLKGGAFLVNDRNGDGRVMDGRELLGPGTGDGMAELSVLDGDGNGWVDEGDAAWSSLYLWEPGDGGGRMTPLSVAGIGAISLAHVAAPFLYRDSSGTPGAVGRSAGIYLTEEGKAGMIQHVDMLA